MHMYGGLFFILCLWIQTGNLVRGQDCRLSWFTSSSEHDSNFDTSGLKESYLLGSTVRVPCRVGYVGSFRMMCVSDVGLRWDYEGSKCQRQSCGPPGDILFAEVNRTKGEEYALGSNVQYSCREGYRMVDGSATRRCTPNGWVWDVDEPECEICIYYLGMKKSMRLISNEQMSASSVKREVIGAGWHAHFGRLDEGGARNAWTAATDDQQQWLQVDLGCNKTITGIITQGDGGLVIGRSYVTSFRVSYSDNGGPGTVVKVNGTEKIFAGNFDSSSYKRNMFDPPISARYVRVLPWEWEHHIAMRMELLGCEPGGCHGDQQLSTPFESPDPSAEFA